MNQYQITLYNNLIALVEKSEAFYYNDWNLDGIWYRNFNYRLASYSDFNENNDALECRGIMFEISEEGQSAELIRLASFPFSKFFNVGENPLVMDLDLSTIVEIADKADGSLITTYMHNDILRVKTKGSLASDQAIAAKLWLHREENVEFREELIAAERLNCTVIMEWCAPDNLIVLGYMEPELKVLGVRSCEDGSYYSYYDIDSEHFPETLKRWTELVDLRKVPYDTFAEFIENVPEMENIEGFVFELESGQRVKVKTEWYLTRHRCKDSVNIPRRLYEAVLEEATDDMRSLFHDDLLAIKLISEMEAFVEVRYNHLVDTVERFYEYNKELDRKEYAILGQTELDKVQFGLAMAKYIGRDFSYKEVMKKRWKSFGLKDEKVEVTE